MIMPFSHPAAANVQVSREHTIRQDIMLHQTFWLAIAIFTLLSASVSSHPNFWASIDEQNRQDAQQDGPTSVCSHPGKAYGHHAGPSQDPTISFSLTQHDLPVITYCPGTNLSVMVRCWCRARKGVMWVIRIYCVYKNDPRSCNCKRRVVLVDRSAMSYITNGRAHLFYIVHTGRVLSR